MDNRDLFNASIAKDEPNGYRSPLLGQRRYPFLIEHSHHMVALLVDFFDPVLNSAVAFYLP